ncbi:delta-60 repeat domain-containing protein [Pseudomonas putida]
MKSTRKSNRLQQIIAQRSAGGEQRKQLPSAPIDENYAACGYAYLMGSAEGYTGTCTNILESYTRANHYYACGFNRASAPSSFNSVIALLDRDGKPDPVFKVDFRAHLPSDESFTPKKIIEDATGKLLCLGMLTTAGQSRLWRFNVDGSLDLTFAERGYIDDDQLLPERIYLERVAATSDGYVVAASDFTGNTLLVALTADGQLNTKFGQDGWVNLEHKLPGEPLGIMGLVVTTGAAERILLLSLRAEDNNRYVEFSVASCVTGKGLMDLSFGYSGNFRSEDGTYYRGISVCSSSAVITLCGGHMLDDDSVLPDITRVDFSGTPVAAFNGGNPVRYDAAGGMWHEVVEVAERLVGFGSFYTHNRAVRYLKNGKLDGTFVPPFGSGQVGATAPNSGFYLDGDASLAVVPGAQRMLLCGDLDDEQGNPDPVVIAISIS